LAERKRVNVYQRILDELREEVLRERRPGDRFPSQNELARRFAASHNTVREALSALVQEGLLERRRGSGTFVADARSTLAAGILIEQDIFHPGASYFFQRVVQSLRDHLSGCGYPVRLYVGQTLPGEPEPPEPTCPEFWSDLEKKRVLGLAVVGTPCYAAFMQRLREEGVALVDPEVAPPEEAPESHDEMLSRGAAYLVAQGHAAVGYLDWGEGGSRVAAFRKGLEAAGGETRDAWCVHAGPPGNLARGYQAFEELWSRRPHPAALLVADDVLYQAVEPALLEKRIRVPEDLAILAHAVKGDPRPVHLPVARLQVDPDAYAASLGRSLVARMERRQAPPAGTGPRAEILGPGPAARPPAC
jgi:DNA-binding LacI/PurR family transcriptional regulator